MRQRAGWFGLLGQAFADSAWAQTEDFLFNGMWAQIQETLGIPVLLAFAMSMALFFVLNRGLRREIQKRIKIEVIRHSGPPS